MHIWKETEMTLPPFAMNRGDGPLSYAQNSSYQRGAVDAAKNIINEEIDTKLDLKQILSPNSTSFNLVDFGCSSGPNTILAVKVILEAIERKLKSINGLNSDQHYPEFHVFFNDQLDNDFKTLFTLLPPTKQFFAATAPGSFYGRLFPKASIHFAYSSCALCWLSKVPGELIEKASPAWNPGRIHYTGAPKQVREAYFAQYKKDVDLFLSSRGEELVSGSLMTLLVPGVPEGHCT